MLCVTKIILHQRLLLREGLETSNGIKSVDDFARSGSKTPVSEIQDSAEREQPFRNKISGKLNHIACKIDPSPLSISGGYGRGSLRRHQTRTGNEQTIHRWTLHHLFCPGVGEKWILTPPR